MHPGFRQFQQLASRPLSFRLFLLGNLPAAFFAGLRIRALTEHACEVSVPYKWFNKNPFRSMYFAIQAMAAEMSTGALAMAQVYRRQPELRLLVVGIEAVFTKKATDTILFSCSDGEAIGAAANKAIQTGEACTVRCRSVGTTTGGEQVAEFYITWSFKLKRTV